MTIHNLSLYELLRFFQKTQEQFARDTGVSVGTVHRWVNNKYKPSPLAQKKIEEVLDAYKKERLAKENGINAA